MTIHVTPQVDFIFSSVNHCCHCLWIRVSNPSQAAAMPALRQTVLPPASASSARFSLLLFATMAQSLLNRCLRSSIRGISSWASIQQRYWGCWKARFICNLEDSVSFPLHEELKSCAQLQKWRRKELQICNNEVPLSLGNLSSSQFRVGSSPTQTLQLQLSRACGTWVKPWDR